MKFGTAFQEALASASYPPHWQEAAIQYKLLKKAIKRVAQELDSIGLHPSVLAALVENSEQAGTLGVHYDGLKDFKPKLVLTYDNDVAGGVPEVGLSEETRRMLVEFAKANSGEVVESDGTSVAETIETVMSGSTASEPDCSSRTTTIEIPLHSDTDFFRSLKSGLSNLDHLQSRQKEVLTNDVLSLSHHLPDVAQPFMAKSDLAVWQDIFGLYLEAGVFFATNEQDHGKRNSTKAQERLEWFQTQISKQNLVSKFRNPQSRTLLAEFFQVNAALLQNLRFQEINEQACVKILKKFDKRTHLSVRDQVIPSLTTNPFMSGSLSKAICFTMRENLLSTVPLLSEYLCPVCQDIVFKPVRLTCSHVFCVRCLVKLQRDKKRFCPLCRSDVVMETTAGNLDTSLLNFLRVYFPREVKVKEIEAGREVVRETFGESMVGGGDGAGGVNSDADLVRCCVM